MSIFQLWHQKKNIPIKIDIFFVITYVEQTLVPFFGNMIGRPIGLTNNDAVSAEHRWVKQIVERLNRTFKASYRVTCGYGSDDGALYGVSLLVAYYNFLRPHPYNYWNPLNEIKEFENVGNMPAKWQILLSLSQQTILHMQDNKAG